jgi:DNA invertase Pin-like site-specific DNA recombinase
VNKVLIWSIDRVGRSLVDLVTFMEACRAAGVSLWLYEQGLDTAGSNGLPLFDVTAMLAFHLRQTRRDRILRGQANRQGQGDEGQAGIGCRKGCATGSAAGGYIGGVGE